MVRLVPPAIGRGRGPACLPEELPGPPSVGYRDQQIHIGHGPVGYARVNRGRQRRPLQQDHADARRIEHIERFQEALLQVAHAERSHARERAELAQPLRRHGHALEPLQAAPQNGCRTLDLVELHQGDPVEVGSSQQVGEPRIRGR